ncbi:hypothetical protein HJFPF1_02471 [Paramyrothecium foliicola]|nr:hypothetical protein HJFPF1_02471 [Paramyrothecium foliicola]
MPLILRGDSRARAYNIAYTALIGFIFIAVVPFAVLSWVRSRSAKDPARRFVPWLQIAFLLFIVTLGLLLAQGILTTYEIYANASHWHIIRSAYHVGYLAEFFRTALSASILVLLLELGPGIHRAVEGVSSRFDKAIRYAAYVVATIVLALAFAYYGLMVDFQENYTNNIGSVTRRDAAERIDTVNRLMATALTLLWAMSLLTISVSIYGFVRRRVSPVKTLIKPAKLNMELCLCHQVAPGLRGGS